MTTAIKESIERAAEFLGGKRRPPHRELMVADILRDASAVALRGRDATTRDVFVTGSANSGKSYIKKLAATAAAMLDIDSLVVEAANRPGSAIDSLFQTDNPGPYKGRPRVHSSVRLVIIEEASLVSAQLLELISKRLGEWTGVTDQPFGGCFVLYLGDLMQLPPSDGGRWIFESPLWRDHVRMLSMMRDPRAPPGSHDWHLGELREGDEACIPYFNGLVLGVDENDSEWLAPRDATLVVATERRARECNESKVRELRPGQAFVTRTTVVPVDSERIRAPVPVLSRREAEAVLPDRVLLCPGVHVMLTQEGETYRNGDVGVVKAIRSRGAIVVRIRRTRENAIVNPMVVDCDDGRRLRGHPLKHAWAVSVRESQGSTLAKLIVDADDLVCPGQLYVALSRGMKRRCARLLQRITPAQIRPDADAVAEYARLNALNEAEFDV